MSFKSQGGKKWIAILFGGTVFLSLVFWWWGGRGEQKTEDRRQKIEKNLVTPTPTSTPVPTVIKSSEITQDFSNLVKDLKGVYSFSAYNLGSKQSYGVRENEVFPAASLMKLPVILTLYREAEAGRIDLETKYTLKKSDKQTGAGTMRYQPDGAVYTYRKMVELMGKQSDNTAFFVIRTLLGDEKIQKTISGLGMVKTSLANFETTASDIGLFFRKLYSGSVVTRQNRDEILGFLTETFDESRIPAGVPKGTRVAHKVGTDIGVISDGGIVFGQQPFVLVIMSKDVLEAEAKEVLPKISSAVWEFENKP